MSLLRALRAGAVLAAVTAVVLAPTSAAAQPEVRLDADGFSPQEVRVVAGEAVVWRNDTDEAQTITADDGSWDSGPLRPGESFSVTLHREGTVAYGTADAAHAGAVVVEAVAEPAGGPDPAAPALPRTGLPLVAAGLAAAGLLGLGGVLLVRAR